MNIRDLIKLAKGIALAVCSVSTATVSLLTRTAAYLKSLTSAFKRALDMYSGVADPPEPKMIYLSVPSKSVCTHSLDKLVQADDVDSLKSTNGEHKLG